MAAYVMANFDFEQIEGNIGVRFVNTDQSSVGSQRVGGVISPANFESDYSFVLPSMNFKWDVNDDLVGRLAVYRSLTRALLTDIAPGRTLENFDGGNGTAETRTWTVYGDECRHWSGVVFRRGSRFDCGFLPQRSERAHRANR